MTSYARSVVSFINSQLERVAELLDDPERAAQESALCRMACELLMDAPEPQPEEGEREDLRLYL